MNLMSLLRTTMFVIAMGCGLCANVQGAQQPEYQIGKGDSIRVVVFQNPDLTVETRVTENGTISYPLVGSVSIGGLTIPAAEQAIAKALSDGGFIQKPQVNIQLVQNRGNQVSVLGAVGRAGRYPLETFDVRISEMIAIAGGISGEGADVIFLNGIRNGKPLRMEIDIPGMFLSNNLKDDIVVAGGDLIYVQRQPMFYIYGEVQRPGSMRVQRDMTFRQALAQSGGPSARGTERRLRVYRRNAESGKIEMLTADLNDYVRADDVIYVNESLF